MGVAYFGNKYTKGIIHYDDVYKYKGFRFRMGGGWSPPEQLKKDGEPRKENTKAFWKAWEEFSKLSDSDQAKYIIN